MTIYISRESDALSLIPNDNAIDIECAPDVYAYIEKERPLYLHEIEGLYFDKDAQEVRFNNQRAPLLEPLLIRSIKDNIKHDAMANYDFMHRFGDRTNCEGFYWVLEYMHETAPKWTIESISENAAAVIRNARIEVDEEAPRSCLLIGKRYMPLYKNIYSIAYSAEQKSMWITYVICPNLTAARIVNEGINDYAEALEFIQKYRAVLDAEKTPLESIAEKSRQDIGTKTGGIYRTSISLSKRYKGIKRNSTGAPMDRDGKALALVSVSGFVRNQAYGKGYAQHRKIWVDGFMRGQWVRSGVTYVRVSK